MLVPFIFYLVPFVAGYGWSAQSPMTPRFAGMATAPGRQSILPTAVEHYGTGVVVVPFQARLEAYLWDGELPLWNPYSGLGQVFAAQGEGSPYFPMAILRALLPSSWSNAITFLTIGISAASLYAFLRVLSLGPGAAAFGGAAWALSGVFTLNVARNNYVDQAAMIPPLFAAAAWAISSRRPVAYVVFAVVVALHASAGLLQMGVNALLLLTAFLIFFSFLWGSSTRDRLRTLVTAFIFLGLGTALAAPYVLPIVEGVRAAYNKNVPFLAFYAMPSANGIAFFFPLVFGQVFQSWIAGRYPDVVDWNNLYAHGSTGLLLLTVLALAALPNVRRDRRMAYCFFLGGLIFFFGRFMSFPPASLVSVLPILSQQSPKHNNWLAVFCLVVAASFGVAWLRQIAPRRAGWLLAAVAFGLVSSIVTVVGRRGAGVELDLTMAQVHLSATLALVALLVAAFWLAHQSATDAQAAIIATAVVVGECSVYLLLGTDDRLVLAVRIAAAAFLVLAGVLVARGARIPSLVAGALVVAAYAWVVIWPSSGLPKRVESDAMPAYMQWLRQEVGHEYRTFGIWPDYSSLGEIQDIEVVGPLATNEWVSYVDLISSELAARIHRAGSTFALAQIYDLNEDYPRARPLLDWVGVRYIVLDKTVFNRRSRDDHEVMLETTPDLRIVYDDDDVTIVESPGAQTKALFTTQVLESSAEATIERLKSRPGFIDGPVAVEVDLGTIAARPDGTGQTIPVPIAEYRPNDLRARFEAPAAGVFVVKDSFFPGWQATINGQPTEVIRVNGLVRGVVVPAAGQYEVTMSYRPASFTSGVWIAAATGALLLVLAAVSGLQRRRSRGPGAVQ